jgi:hypothetical protein
MPAMAEITAQYKQQPSRSRKRAMGMEGRTDVAAMALPLTDRFEAYDTQSTELVIADHECRAHWQQRKQHAEQ